MKIELKNGLYRKLSDIRVLAVIAARKDIPTTCCGLNIKMNHTQRTENDFDEYINKFVSNRKTVHAYLVNKTVRIPIDIHGGNTNECYFGYINPTIFESF